MSIIHEHDPLSLAVRSEQGRGPAAARKCCHTHSAVGYDALRCHIRPRKMCMLLVTTCRRPPSQATLSYGNSPCNVLAAATAPWSYGAENGTQARLV